jgi:hypothetical protein
MWPPRAPIRQTVGAIPSSEGLRDAAALRRPREYSPITSHRSSSGELSKSPEVHLFGSLVEIDLNVSYQAGVLPSRRMML